MVISKALAEGSAADILDRGLRPEMMPTPEDATALRFLLEFKKEHGSVPSPQALESKVPEYDLPYAPDPLSFYVDEVIRGHVQSGVSDLLLSSAKKVGREDPFELANTLRRQATLLEALQGRSQDLNFLDRAQERYESYLKRRDSQGVIGIATPWASLDQVTQGWQKGMYAAFAARPGVGKTWMLLRLAMFAAWEDRARVLFINNELGQEKMDIRMDALRFKLPYGAFLRGELTAHEEEFYREGLKMLEKQQKDVFFQWVHNVNTPQEIAAKVEQYQPDIVFVDGAYLLRSEDPKLSGWAQQEDISRSLKSISSQYEIPVLISVQLAKRGDATNRKGKSGKRSISQSDVAHSDAYVQDVDLLFGLEQTADMKARSEIRIVSLKVRDGQDAEILLGWDFETMESEDRGIQHTHIDFDDAEDELDFAA